MVHRKGMNMSVDAGTRGGPHRGVPGFLIVSGALIAVTVVSSGLLVAKFFRDHAVAHEERHIAESIAAEAREDLTPAVFELPPDPARAPLFRHLLRGYPGIFRIKVYDREARVIWSNEPRLIGMTFPDDPDLVRALAGKVTTRVGAPDKRENLYEKRVQYLSEVYVPVTFPGNDAVVGVIEAYKDVTLLVLGIGRVERFIWATTSGMGLFLFLGIAFIAWKAGANERRALRRLADQNAEIREAHARLAAIVEGITDRIVLIDRRARVVWTNAPGTDANDQHRSAARGSCFTGVAAGSAACQECPAVRTFESGLVERSLRVDRSPDGKTRYFDLVTAPLRDPAGEVYEVLEVARDVTEMVQMEERLTRANQALVDTQVQLVEKERLAAVGEVVVGLHHAILNPLAGILGALQVLKRDVSAADQAAALAAAEVEIRKIERLIRNLDDLRHAKGVPYVGQTTMLDVEGLQRPTP